MVERKIGEAVITYLWKYFAEFFGKVAEIFMRKLHYKR